MNEKQLSNQQQKPFAWNKYPLLRILIPFLGGIVIAFYSNFSFSIVVLLAIVAVSVLSVVLLYKYRKYQNRGISGLLLVISIFLFSLAYTQFLIDAGKPHQPLNEKDKQVFTATVIETPTIKQKSIMLIVNIEQQKYDKSSSKAIVYVERDKQSEKIIYGDKLLFYSYLNEISAPKNPKEFDYKRYLSIKNLYIQSYADAKSWQKIGENNGNFIMLFANHLRNRFLKIFQDCNMDVQEYGVIAAILLGYNGELDPDLIRSYSSTGATHILSVSGLHVGIIYMILAFLLRFLDRTKRQRMIRTFILLAAIWLYACITGLSPPVMRAAAMFSFIALAGVLERTTNSYNSLIASLIFLLCANPLLLFDVGFQFSYLAVFGIIWLQQPLKSLYKPQTKAGSYVWDIIAVSIAAQLLTAPLAIWYFHQFPNYFLLTNVIVITITPFVMGLGMAVLVLSFWKFVYQYLSIGLMYSIKSMNWVIIRIEDLPYSVTGKIDISGFQVVFAFLLIVIAASAFLSKKKIFVYQALAIAIILLGMDIYKQIKVNRQQEIVFYSLKSGYAIDCIDGQNSVLICDSNTIQDKQIYNFSIKNNHIYHRIKNMSSQIGQQRIKVHNKTILIVDKPIYALTGEEKLKADYILLSNNVIISVEVLQKMFDFEMLIVDGSYSGHRLNNLRKTCAEKLIPFHDLKNYGAMIIDND